MNNMFKNNIKYLLDTGKLTTKKILQITGHKSKSLVSMWCSGERIITTKDAVSLCNHLGITVNDLINTDLREIYNSYDDLVELFIQNKDLLTEDDKDTIRFIIEKRIKENDIQR